MTHAIFEMTKDRREHLISSHKFYVAQAKERLLSQFDDIEGEADAYGKTKRDEYSAYYNPETDNSYDLQEAADNEMCSHYHMLNEMYDLTLLSVISGMFHEWEKQLRNWINFQIQRVYKGDHIKKAICKADFVKLIKLFKHSDWLIQSKPYYVSLNRCRLVVNAYKHGEGDSLECLRNKHPDLINEVPDVFSSKSLNIKTEHLEEFSKSILEFWGDVPEYIYDNHDVVIAWLGDAYLKDK